MLSTFFDGMEVLTTDCEWPAESASQQRVRGSTSESLPRLDAQPSREHGDQILAPDLVAQGGRRAEISRFQARYPAVFRCNPSNVNEGERAPPSASTRLRSKHDTLGRPHRSANERLSSLTRSLSPDAEHRTP